MEKVKNKDLINYNPKYHFNHNKPWTSKDLEYALDYKNDLKDISLKLGRTISSILQKRKLQRFWKEADKHSRVKIIP